MKFTLSWLKDHLDTNASLNEITDKLTALGLELEGIEDPSAKFAPFKVAYVEKAQAHPDADRLQVCIVDTGEEKVQVVCGAPNARQGMKGIFAPAGSYIPGTDMTLKKGKIRGEESNGMLVSEREMGLSDEHEGIIDLPEDTKIGTPFTEIFGNDDPVIDIALTPDRGDCAGVRGIARDLAAAGLGKLKPLPPHTPPASGGESSEHYPSTDGKESSKHCPSANGGESHKHCPSTDVGDSSKHYPPASGGDQGGDGNGKSPINVKLNDGDNCPLFMGRFIKNIENKQSPTWMQNRLKAIGLRPISTLVDITNYVTHDLCRPLHVYDADLVKGDINVRAAKDGEEFDALNDKSYTTHEGMTAISDDSGILGLGGIVGGVSTSCTETTKNVFVECAYFDPMTTARTGRILQIDSDARYRFERGVDPEFTVTGIEIATRLILELCGGEPSEVVQAGKVPPWKREIEFDPAYTKKLSGMDVKANEQLSILKSLGFVTSPPDFAFPPASRGDSSKYTPPASRGDSSKYTPPASGGDQGGEMFVKITPPSWRSDVEGRADLVEEIVRVIGYDNIEAVSVRSTYAISNSAETPNITKSRLARTALAARGLSECVTWSFMGKALAGHFGSNDNSLTLTNPISSDWNQMRPSILPNLITAAGANADKGAGDCSLFEVGPVFASAKPDGQLTQAAGIRYGATGAKHWSSIDANRAHDIYDAKADVFAALEAAGVPTGNLQTAREASNHFHPGRSATLRLGKNVLAQFGEIHPGVLDAMDVKGNVIGFEVFLDNLPEAKSSKKSKGPAKSLLQLSQFQPVFRDYAFIVDENVEVETITRAAKGAERNLIAEVSVFDVYQGKGIDDGKKSIAINVILQPVKQTLLDTEIEGISQKIVDAVQAKTGAVLRG